MAESGFSLRQILAKAKPVIPAVMLTAINVSLRLETQFMRPPIGGIDFSQLRAMGVIPARALNYGKPMTVDWSKPLDGMIVLRQETPAMAKP